MWVCVCVCVCVCIVLFFALYLHCNQDDIALSPEDIAERCAASFSSSDDVFCETPEEQAQRVGIIETSLKGESDLSLDEIKQILQLFYKGHSIKEWLQALGWNELIRHNQVGHSRKYTYALTCYAHYLM